MMEPKPRPDKRAPIIELEYNIAGLTKVVDRQLTEPLRLGAATREMNQLAAWQFELKRRKLYSKFN